MKTLLILLSLMTFNAMAAGPEDIVGVWWSPEQKTKVEITKVGKKYEGRIIAVRPESKDKLNTNDKDKNRRNEKILGLKILKDFTFNGERWTDGTIYDPENGKTYKSILWFNDSGDKVLNVRGYIGFALIGRTAEFKKVEGDAPLMQQAGEPDRVYLEK